MKLREFRQLIQKMIKEEINTYINEKAEKDESNKNDREKAGRQVMNFLNSLEKSQLRKKLNSIDTDKEKIEILTKFADMINFPKNKISKLSSELKS